MQATNGRSSGGDGSGFPQRWPCLGHVFFGEIKGSTWRYHGVIMTLTRGLGDIPKNQDAAKQLWLQVGGRLPTFLPGRWPCFLCTWAIEICAWIHLLGGFAVIYLWHILMFNSCGSLPETNHWFYKKISGYISQAWTMAAWVAWRLSTMAARELKWSFVGTLRGSFRWKWAHREIYV